MGKQPEDQIKHAEAAMHLGNHVNKNKNKGRRQPPNATRNINVEEATPLLDSHNIVGPRRHHQE